MRVYPASSKRLIISRWRSASGPHATTSSTSSGETMPAAWAKWPGIGSSWPPSPLIAMFGQSSCAVLTAWSRLSAQHAWTCPTFGPLPPALSKTATVSFSAAAPAPTGLVEDVDRVLVRSHADEAVADASRELGGLRPGCGNVDRERAT